MKKLILITTAVIGITGHTWSQPTEEKKESVEIQIEGNKVIIEAEDMDELSQIDLNEILREVANHSKKVMQQQQELMAQVDEQRAAGEITEEQAEEMREMITEQTEERMEVIGELMEAWGEQYEARMEAWENEYEAKMEAWEAEVEARSGRGEFIMPPLPPIPPVPAPDASAPVDSNKKARKIIIDDEGITIRKGEDGEEPFALKFEKGEKKSPKELGLTNSKIDRTETTVDIHLGFNQMLRGGKNFITSGNEELNFWKSTDFSLGMGGKTRIGSPYSKLYFKWGGEFSWNNFRLTGNNILHKRQDSERVEIRSDTLRSISMSKYRILYFNVPLMLQLDFSEVGEMDDSFTLGVGGYGGVRINTKRELEYSNDVYDNAEEEVKGDFYTNQFRYGIMAQMGWDSFKITASYDLNPFFQPGKGPDYQMAALTFGLTL